MKSINVWVIAIEVMKIARVRGVVRFKRTVEKLIVIIATRLMWIPGVRPVRVPASNPRRIAIVISSIMIMLSCLSFVC